MDLSDETCRLAKSSKTGDHIPPKSFFPHGTKQVRVPACAECNGSFASLDSLMKQRISLASQVTPSEVIARTFGGLKGAGHLAKLELHEVIDESGKDRFEVRFDDLNLSGWMGRIIQGLYYVETGQLLPKHVKFVCKAPFDAERNEVGRKLLDDLLEPPLERREACFCYFTMSVDANGVYPMHWFTIFYQKVVFYTELLTPECPR